MHTEAIEQYNRALKAGQKYSKAALARGEDPAPPALDEILSGKTPAGQVDLGVLLIPTERIVGTKTAGRVSALAGNFMPLLPPASEFGAKWISLCDAHLSEEGIRDPIKCYEYLGRFYIEEGNKRASVLMSYGAPSIHARVIRVLPQRSDAPEIRLYYEFLDFYALSGLYTVELLHPGDYARLQAALGFEPDHVWTEEERRRFSSGFTVFQNAFEKVRARAPESSAAEALLVWLQLYPFASLRNLTAAELSKQLNALWPDVAVRADDSPLAVSTEPDEREKTVLSKLLSVARSDHIDIAFLYAYDPATSAWTRAHDEGRQYLEEALGDQVSVRVVHAYNHDYLSAMETAIEAGARLIFATTPAMIAACRKTAALHPEVKILNCSLSQPYTGVRMYYGRLYEYKFIAGAIAGVMGRGGRIGYVADYPIFGVPAGINAFALGVRMVDPEARILLRWSCTSGDPAKELLADGVTVLSDRDAIRPGSGSLELGTYMLREDGTPLPLITPIWNWGRLYEQIVRSIFSGAWADIARSKAIHYWWGMDSGVIDARFGDALPAGVRALGSILRGALIADELRPFRTEIRDQAGLLRFDASSPPGAEEIIRMDWLCDNVDGEIPAFEKILPMSRDTVRLLGVYRESLPPEKEEKQL